MFPLFPSDPPRADTTAPIPSAEAERSEVETEPLILGRAIEGHDYLGSSKTTGIWRSVSSRYSSKPGLRLANSAQSGVIEGDFHWHKHDHEDEFFLVLEGELVIELEGRDSVRLHPNQGYTVPKGILHKTSAPVRTVIVMVESAGVVPTGD